MKNITVLVIAVIVLAHSYEIHYYFCNMLTF